MKSEVGSIEMTFRGFTTHPIESNAPPELIKQRLEWLPSVTAVDVEYSGTHACESPANEIAITFTQDFGNLPSIAVEAHEDLTIDVATSGEDFSSFKQSADGIKENVYCPGRGICYTKSGSCSCFVQYTNSNGLKGDTESSRADCGAPIETTIECPGKIPCNGHGVCSSYPSYACTCQEGWYGADCAGRTCQKRDPSGLAFLSKTMSCILNLMSISVQSKEFATVVLGNVDAVCHSLGALASTWHALERSNVRAMGIVSPLNKWQKWPISGEICSTPSTAPFLTIPALGTRRRFVDALVTIFFWV